MSWYPAGLAEPLVRLARAVEQTFQPLQPKGPTRLAAYTTAELQALTPTAYATAVDKTAGKPVFAVLNMAGTGFRWVYADGTAV